MQHDAAVNPGSSGGPLVDAAGRLVGMNVRIADGSRMFVGISYAIGAADLDRIVAGLLDGSAQPYPALGLRGRAVEGAVAGALGLAPGGVLVDAVDPGGLAATSGLRPGDVMLAVDRVALTAPGDLAFAVEAALPKGEADVAVLRGGKSLVVMLALTAPEVAPVPPKGPDSFDLAQLGLVMDGPRVGPLAEGSIAAQAGLAAGDTILAVNGQGAALPQTIRAPLLLRLAAPDGRTRHVLLDPFTPAQGFRPVGGANVLDPAVVVF